MLGGGSSQLGRVAVEGEVVEVGGYLFSFLEVAGRVVVVKEVEGLVVVD